MKTLANFIIVLLLGLFSSCTVLILKLMGAKKPGIESYENIQKKYIEMNFSLEQFYIMKEDSLFNQFFRHPNEVRLFDKNGFMILEDSLAGMKGCSGNIVTFMSSVPPVTYAHRDSSQSLHACLESIRHIQDSTQLSVNKVDFDYLAIVYWNMFSGKVRNEEHLKSIQYAINENKHSKFQLIPVNCDMYEGVDWDKKLEEYKARVKASRATN